MYASNLADSKIPLRDYVSYYLLIAQMLNMSITPF